MRTVFWMEAKRGSGNRQTADRDGGQAKQAEARQQRHAPATRADRPRPPRRPARGLSDSCPTRRCDDRRRPTRESSRRTAPSAATRSGAEERKKTRKEKRRKKTIRTLHASTHAQRTNINHELRTSTRCKSPPPPFQTTFIDTDTVKAHDRAAALVPGPCARGRRARARSACADPTGARHCRPRCPSPRQTSAPGTD